MTEPAEGGGVGGWMGQTNTELVPESTLFVSRVNSDHQGVLL